MPANDPGALRGSANGIRDTIVCCPPLVVTRAEIDRLASIIRRSLDEAEPILRALKPEAAG